MRVLKFDINGQIIEQNPDCDFSGLVPGTKGYIQAEFHFSSDWDGYVKVASFRSRLGKEYTPQVLKDGRSCVIPSEALDKQYFKIQIIGKKGDSIMKTNKVEINQDGGR